MRILSRYILRRFAFSYAVIATSLMALIVTLDLLTHSSEFVAVGVQAGGNRWHQAVAGFAAVVGFYTPFSLVFVGYLGGLIAVGAAGFTLASMVRTRELTAMLAAGISLHRVARILLLAGAVVVIVMLADQEWFIPTMLDRLARNQDDVKNGDFHLELDFTPDPSGALLTARDFNLAGQTLAGLTILGRNSAGHTVWRIDAERASWDARRGGWALVGGLRLDSLDGTLAAPAPATAVNFFPSTLDPLTLMALRNSRVRHMLSALELRRMLSTPAIGLGAEFRQILHGRFSIAVVNLLVLAMSLCFFLPRVPTGLIVRSCKAMAVSLVAWHAAFLLVNAPPTGLPPVVVAWLPVVLYLPFTVYMMSSLET